MLKINHLSLSRMFLGDFDSSTYCVILIVQWDHVINKIQLWENNGVILKDGVNCGSDYYQCALKSV